MHAYPFFAARRLPWRAALAALLTLPLVGLLLCLGWLWRLATAVRVLGCRLRLRLLQWRQARQARPVKPRRSLLQLLAGWTPMWASLWALSGCGTAPLQASPCPPVPAHLLTLPPPPVLLTPGSAWSTPGPTTRPTPPSAAS